jgi:two-component system chemotaxis sensor kinase CheA
MLQNQEFIQGFVEEARGHVETIESELVKMDSSMADAESINNIFRAVHSVKGTAGFFNLTKIVELSHAMENIFGEFRTGGKQISGKMTDVLLSANDCLKAMVEDVVNSENYDISDQMAALGRIFGEAGAAKAPGHKKRRRAGAGDEDEDVFIAPDQKEKAMREISRGSGAFLVTCGLNRHFIGSGADPMELVGKMKSIGKILCCDAVIDGAESGGDPEDISLRFLLTTVLEKDLLTGALGIDESCIRKLNWELIEPLPADKDAGSDDAAAQSSADSRPSAETQGAMEKSTAVTVEDSIRVHVTLLNNLLNLASEMVLVRNQLMRAMENHRKNIGGIDPILQNLDHITTDLQEKIMQTRMQPIANVFNRFPRIIRELSRKLNKDISLKLEGSDVELDKSIIEALGDPLTHLIRNAADHGLETPAERENAGKPRTGFITMKAYHEGGYVNIDIIDDGKGIDVEKVREKAIEKGLISKTDAAVMGELEVLRLLFNPGFSTADKITDLSGRGVGMDVVKTNIEKLGGTIEIFTASGKGTTFRLLLPLTLAIIPSLIVEVEDQKFALPQVNLQEIVRIKPGDETRRVEYVNNAEVLRLRGRLLPIVHLADVLGIKRTYIDPVTGERKPERRKLVIGRKNFASGSAKRSDGEQGEESRKPTLSNIIRILVVKIGSRRIGIAVNAIHGSEEILVKPLPFHIKDSKCYSGVTILGDGKTVMILDPGGIIEKANLRFIEGSEEKKGAELDEEGDRMREQQNLLIFKCSGPEMLALDLSMVSRVEEISADEIETVGNKEFIKFRGETLRVIRPENYLAIGKQESKNDRLYVIIPKLVKQKMGILIEKIHDTIQTAVNLKQDDATKGFIGSTIIGNRIVLLVNIYELFELVDPKLYKQKSTVRKGKTLTVLLAEDTPFFQKLEKSYLEDAGFNVITAANGKEALQILQTNKVDAVLSDINMPVMDGLELVRKIREDERLSGLPVVAVTSLTNENQVKKGMEAGFDAYEFKLDRVRLIEVLEQTIQKRRKAV